MPNSKKYKKVGKRIFTCAYCKNEFESGRKRKYCCKECREKDYNEKNKERIRERDRKRYEEHKMPYKNKEKKKCEWCKKEFEPNKFNHNQKFCCKKCRKKKYHEKHKDEARKYLKEHKKKPEVRKKLNEWQKEYSKKNREKVKGYQNKWIEKIGREKINGDMRDYRKLPQVKDRINKQVKKRRKEDTLFRLKNNLRIRLSIALKTYSQTGKIMTAKSYGINYKKIIEQLKPFPKDIENYEVDHIVPLSWFNFNDPKEIKWAFAPENHQWLTKEKNRAKHNCFIG